MEFHDTTTSSSSSSLEERHEFKSDSKQLIKTFTDNFNNGNPHGFIRELISNASDAHDKLALVKDKYDEKLYEDESAIQIDSEPFINIMANEKDKTLVISDNGIGMTYDGLMNNIGVIASSGTKEFSKNNNVETMIGQFGLGFYSVFVVSNNVTILTTSFNEDNVLETYSWKSTDGEDFTIQKLSKGTNRPGTSIILHINDEFLDILKENIIVDNIRKYTFYVKYAINIIKRPSETAKNQEPYLVRINCLETPIWRLKKSELKDEDYKKFYRESIVDNMLSQVEKDPLIYVHKKYVMSDGINVSFIFYIPPKAPFDLGEEDEEHGNKMKLYCKGILISDTQTDYYPQWMNFAQGIIEIDGLQLNINRQSHSDTKMVKSVKNKITEEFIKIMQELKQDKYTFFHTLNREFGDCIKMGIIEELSDRKKPEDEHIGISHAKDMFNLLLFHTSKNRQVSLDVYVDDMPEDQIGIYYIAGGNHKILKNSPFIEKIIVNSSDSEEKKRSKKDYEILFFTDNIDEHIKNYLVGYKKDEKRIIVGIEDSTDKSKEETTLKVYDDINFDDMNTKRFVDVARGDLLVKFDESQYLTKTQTDKLIKILKRIYESQKIHLHDIKISDKFETIPAVVVSQVNITAQFENCLNNQNISRRKDQYEGVLKRKNLLVSPSNKTIKYLYQKLVEEKINEKNTSLVEFCKNLHSSAMLVGGYQLEDYVSYARSNFENAHNFIENNI
jgi:molecular chaperone HtpG